MVGVLLFKYKITSSFPAHCTSWELCGDKLEQHMERGACAHRSQVWIAGGAAMGAEGSWLQPCSGGLSPLVIGSAANSLATVIDKAFRSFWV